MPASSLPGVFSDERRNTSNSTHLNSPSLPLICTKVNERLEAFLASEPKTERLRGVQEQSRLSLRIIEEALEKYRLAVGQHT